MILQGVGPGPGRPGRFENYFYCRPRVLLFVNSNLRLQRYGHKYSENSQIPLGAAALTSSPLHTKVLSKIHSRTA